MAPMPAFGQESWLRWGNGWLSNLPSVSVWLCAGHLAGTAGRSACSGCNDHPHANRSRPQTLSLLSSPGLPRPRGWTRQGYMQKGRCGALMDAYDTQQPSNSSSQISSPQLVYPRARFLHAIHIVSQPALSRRLSTVLLCNASD